MGELRDRVMQDLGNILPGEFVAHRGLFASIVMVREKGSWSMGVPVKIESSGAAKIVDVYYIQMVVTLLAFWPAFLILLIGLPGFERAKAAAKKALPQLPAKS